MIKDTLTNAQKKKLNVLKGSDRRVDVNWRKAVKQCSVILTERFDAKLKIAALAISCCYRSDGTPHPRQYSLVKFAKEIGMAHGTLKEWVNLKRTVWDKLSEKNKNPNTFTVYRARTIRKVAGPQATNAQVNAVYRDMLSVGGGERLKFRQYIDRLNSIKFNSLDHNKLKSATDGQLLEIQSLCAEISENITKYRRRKK